MTLANLSRKIDLGVRHYTRRLLQTPTTYVHDPAADKPHVFLFSTRRGGSTLVRNMIYSQPGFNYIDQPLDLSERQFNPYRNELPNPPGSQFISISEEQNTLLFKYFQNFTYRKVCS